MTIATRIPSSPALKRMSFMSGLSESDKVKSATTLRAHIRLDLWIQRRVDRGRVTLQISLHLTYQNHLQIPWQASTDTRQINACPILVLSWVSVGLQAALSTCTNSKCQVAHDSEYRVVRSADGEIELRAPEEKLVEMSSRTPSAEELDSGTTVVTQSRCHGDSETARVQGVRCRVVFSEVRRGFDRVSLKSRC